KETQLVFDTTTEDIRKELGKFLETFKHLIRFVGANNKVDYKVSKLYLNFEMLYNYDVIIADQKLYQNMGYIYSLEAIHIRHLNKTMKYSKDIRNDFINQNENIVFEEKHILYAAEDIAPLLNI